MQILPGCGRITVVFHRARLCQLAVDHRREAVHALQREDLIFQLPGADLDGVLRKRLIRDDGLGSQIIRPHALPAFFGEILFVERFHRGDQPVDLRIVADKLDKDGYFCPDVVEVQIFSALRQDDRPVKIVIARRVLVVISAAPGNAHFRFVAVGIRHRNGIGQLFVHVADQGIFIHHDLRIVFRAQQGLLLVAEVKRSAGEVIQGDVRKIRGKRARLQGDIARAQIERAVLIQEYHLSVHIDVDISV